MIGQRLPDETPEGYPADYERRLRLRDGREVLVRPILPSDARELSPRLTTVDYVCRFALVAVDPAAGRGIAMARYEPLEDGVAEVAVAVDPAWRRVGLATALVEMLAEAALERGIHSFGASCLAENRPIDAMLARTGTGIKHLIEHGVAELAGAREPERDGPRATADPTPATLRRWRRMLADEREEAGVYRGLAARRSGEERQILLGLADAEDRHAAHWERLLGEQVGEARRGSLRMRVVAFLARHLGWVFVLALVQHTESRTDADVARGIAADDRIHGEVVRGLAAQGRATLSGTLRAAVFGANDGAVSNFALVLGVIGGGASARTVLLAGLSGLLAGACSMAAGEYVSVSSQRELLAASKPDESAAAAVTDLDVDANELALVYRARGMPAEEAGRRAQLALRRGGGELMLPEAGAEAAEVVGTGTRAAWLSFAFFCAGAVIPVLPFLFGLGGVAAVVVAGIMTGTALMLTGATVGVLSGMAPLRRALRQLAIGGAAALITFLLGLAVGASVG